MAKARETARRLTVRRLAIICVLIAAASPAAAQDYPSRPLTFIVSTTAGASPDIVARIFAKYLGEALQKAVVVENRGGANGQIAVDDVVRAPADGYTFLVAPSSTLSTNPLLSPKTAAAAITGLKPVSKLVDLDFVITARPSLGLKTIGDLVQRAKAEPGKLNAASTAVGSTAYLIGELFKQSFSVNFVTVTYNGGGQAINAVVGDTADLLFETIALSKPLIDAGKLIPLATTGASRSSFLPDVPTLKEAGAEGFDVSGWVGLAAPKGVSDDIVARVYRHLAISVQNQELRNILAGLKALPVVNSPDEFGNELRQERQMWDRVIKKAGISLE